MERASLEEATDKGKGGGGRGRERGVLTPAFCPDEEAEHGEGDVTRTEKPGKGKRRKITDKDPVCNVDKSKTAEISLVPAKRNYL